jgi:hypothetical protein
MGLIVKGRDFAPIEFIFAVVSAIQRAPVQRVAAAGCDNAVVPSVSISRGIPAPADD